MEKSVVEIETGEVVRILLKLEEDLLEPAQIENKEHPGEHREQAQHPVGDRGHEEGAQLATRYRSDMPHDSLPDSDSTAGPDGNATLSAASWVVCSVKI